MYISEVFEKMTRDAMHITKRQNKNAQSMPSKCLSASLIPKLNAMMCLQLAFDSEVADVSGNCRLCVVVDLDEGDALVDGGDDVVGGVGDDAQNTSNLTGVEVLSRSSDDTTVLEKVGGPPEELGEGDGASVDDDAGGVAQAGDVVGELEDKDVAGGLTSRDQGSSESAGEKGGGGSDD